VVAVLLQAMPTIFNFASSDSISQASCSVLDRVLLVFMVREPGLELLPVKFFLLRDWSAVLLLISSR